MKDKEAIYDAEIAPLMKQIIAVCKREEIAMIASFDIPNKADPEMICTTCLPDEQGTPSRHERAFQILRGSTGVPPMKITTRNADGQITGMETIIG